MLKSLSISVCAVTALLVVGCTPSREPVDMEMEGVIFREMPVELLPAMNVPRRSHSLLTVNGEVVAIGGHTTGFVPTRTAEYYSGGSWHLMDTYYTHDDGFAVALKSGEVMVGGGYSGDFGIGQSFGTELYHPVTHSFTHLPILDQKRTHVSALELDGGEVLITGNWYAPDKMELYTPETGFQKVKEVSQARSFPYVLRSGQDNAMVFALRDNYGNPLEPILIDRLEGESFTVPLLEQWRPAVPVAGGTRMAAFEVGNYSYLIPVSNGEGALAAMLVSGEEFSLLELEHPIPTNSPWGAIQYDDNFFTDKDKGIAWLLGADANLRVYLLELGYGTALRDGKAPVKVYYTPPIDGLIAGIADNLSSIPRLGFQVQQHTALVLGRGVFSKGSAQEGVILIAIETLDSRQRIAFADNPLQSVQGSYATLLCAVGRFASQRETVFAVAVVKAPYSEVLPLWVVKPIGGCARIHYLIKVHIVTCGT